MCTLICGAEAVPKVKGDDEGSSYGDVNRDPFDFYFGGVPAFHPREESNEGHIVESRHVCAANGY